MIITIFGRSIERRWREALHYEAFPFGSIPNTPMFYYSLQCVSNSIGADGRFCRMFARLGAMRNTLCVPLSILGGL